MTGEHPINPLQHPRLAEIRKSLVVGYVIGTFIVIPVIGILLLQ